MCSEDDEIIPLRYGELLNDAIPVKCLRVLREARSLCRFMDYYIYSPSEIVLGQSILSLLPNVVKVRMKYPSVFSTSSLVTYVIGLIFMVYRIHPIINTTIQSVRNKGRKHG